MVEQPFPQVPQSLGQLEQDSPTAVVQTPSPQTGPEGMHMLVEEQAVPTGQLPQLPPQPSLPHCLPVQLGTQVGWQRPDALHEVPAGQLPQLPPQPSLPHILLAQLGTQLPTHW